jgi:hypothetical protein
MRRYWLLQEQNRRGCKAALLRTTHTLDERSLSDLL